jgi:hypothetical protein
MMSKRYNEPFITAIDDNDIVRKAAQNEAFCSLLARYSKHGREGKETILYNIKASLNFSPFPLGPLCFTHFR